MGKHALVSCLTKCLHPTKVTRQKHPLVGKNRVAGGLSVVREELKKANRAMQRCVVATHPDFGETELCAAKRWLVVTAESPEELFFGTNRSAGQGLCPVVAMASNGRAQAVAWMMTTMMKLNFMGFLQHFCSDSRPLEAGCSCGPSKPAFCGVKWHLRALGVLFVHWMAPRIFSLCRDRSRNMR
jgi:hypothetical protein